MFVPRLVLAAAVCLVACLAASAAAAHGADQSPPAGSIQALVSMYRHGDHAAAMAEFLKWDAKRVARNAVLPNDAEPADVAALALMHTAAAVARGTFGSGNQQPFFDRTYFPAALDLVNSLSKRADASGDESLRAFCRDWYVVAVSLWSASRDYVHAAAVARDGRRCLGDEPQLLLAAGSVAEVQMGLLAGLDARTPVPTSNVGKLPDPALNAEDWLRQAVSRSPGLVEARVRLGRVLYLINRVPQARKELERALADATAGSNTFVAYLAALFLGELLEYTGQLDEACSAYEKAIALNPEYQAAHLALGHALVAAGKPAEGWAAARRVFGDAGKPRNPAMDPWFLYRSAQFWQAQSLLQGLFEWVRR